jgi:hypothetical protein
MGLFETAPGRAGLNLMARTVGRNRNYYQLGVFSYQFVENFLGMVTLIFRTYDCLLESSQATVIIEITGESDECLPMVIR